MPREVRPSKTSAPTTGDYSEAIRTYIRDRAERAAAPRSAEVRQQLEDLGHIANRLLAATRELFPATSNIIDLSAAEIEEIESIGHNLRQKAATGLKFLTDRGAAKGGNRNILNLLRPSTPKYNLIMTIYHDLKRRNLMLGSAYSGTLYNTVCDALTEAGEEEPEVGISDIIKNILSRKKKRAEPFQ